MGTKKDIGKVFQEKFKDFEQAPDAGTWNIIANELEGNGGKRYPLLLWIAVSVVLLGLLGVWVWQPWQSNTTSPSLVNQPETQTIPSNQGITSSPNNQTATKYNLTTTITDVESEQDAINKNTPIITSNKTEKTTTTNTISNKETQQETSSIVTTTSPSNINSNTTLATTNNTTRPSSSQGVAAGKTSTQVNIPTSTTGIINIDEATKAQMAAREQNARKAYRAKIAAQRKAFMAQIEKDKKLAQFKRDSVEKAQEKALAMAKAKQENAKEATKKIKDKKDAPKTAAERAEDRKEAVTYNFSVSTYTSLLSYGSLVKGSSIDDRLVDNPREAIATQGYGVRLEYVLNERSGFRFGVGVAPLKYRTNNFQVLNNGGTINVYQFSGLTPTQLEQGGTPTDPQAVAFFNDYDVITIEQNISYIELPMDYQYKLINKRVGLSLNPGLSVFILTENSVFAIANDNTRLRIGRETSLNDLSFAFNLGLGGFYNFAKNWRLDVEPTFRYQLNPYSNNLGNFRPYYIGVQFGATYKF